MYVTDLISNVTKIQYALSSISVLQLTSFLYPQQASVIDGKSFDFVIVGAGSAGSVVANRLSEDPKVSVLLVEAGGDPPISSNIPGLYIYNIGSRIDWAHSTEPNKDAYQCLQDYMYPANHGKVLGGSSSINGMFYVRGHPDDFNSWAAVTDDHSWNYTNVLPYFKKSERLEDNAILRSRDRIYHGTRGYLRVTKVTNNEMENFKNVFQEIGYDVVLDINGKQNIGFSKQLFTFAGGLRQSTANAFLSPIKNRPNLHVLKETLAQKIIFDKNKASGVMLTGSNNNTFEVKANKEVIVSAGALNSPQLLLLSGIGPKEDLIRFNKTVVADLPVGQNLQNQQFMIMAIRMPQTNQTPAPVNPYELNSANFATGYLKLNASETSPDYQAILQLFGADGFTRNCIVMNFNNEICQYFYNELKDMRVLYIGITNFKFKTRGVVTLRNSDPNENPLISLKPYSEETDLEEASRNLEDIARIVDTTYLKSLGAELVTLPSCMDFERGSREYWKCYAQCMTTSGLHFSSTCAMGSVVDSRLRVHGVKGLRVVDASVMPFTTSGNTNAPTIMIGEKAADMIKQDNRMKI